MLRLAVRDAAGAPVAGARVTATRAEGATVHPLIEPVTDADGRLGLPGLAPGRYTIRVVAPGLAPATTDVEVRAVLGADLQIRLEPRD
jgi:protocatechuate 3,4-dioxygenase beta subunit